jgi:hypothetical protein
MKEAGHRNIALLVISYMSRAVGIVFSVCYAHTAGGTALRTVQLGPVLVPEHIVVPPPGPALLGQPGQPATAPSAASAGCTPADALRGGPCGVCAAYANAAGGAGTGCTGAEASWQAAVVAVVAGRIGRGKVPEPDLRSTNA